MIDSKMPNLVSDDLLSQRVTLSNKRGLHARASARFVTTVSQFDALITVTGHNTPDDETVEADSIMELLMLGAACGDDITISARGIERDLALDALVKLIESQFGEGE